MDNKKNSHSSSPPVREGDLYKTVTTFGKTFDLRYGFYEECDKQSLICEMSVLYPDFLKDPLYTDKGEPFVTMMQDSCDSYEGKSKRTPDTTCAECNYFVRGEEWFGICSLVNNLKPDDIR
jgi:hypothetical protein